MPLKSFPALRLKEPLSLLEDMASDSGWSWQRYKKHETLIVIDDFFCPVYFLGKWQGAREKLVIQGFFSFENLRQYKNSMGGVAEALNRNLDEASFTFCVRSNRFIFEKELAGHTRGVMMLNKIESMLFNALGAGERLCEAVNLLVEQGKNENEAIFAAITPLMGHA